MIAILVLGFIGGYALVYSGMSDLAGTPISAVQALTGPKADKGKGGGGSGAPTAGPGSGVRTMGPRGGVRGGRQ